jgi:hypothetical protein
MHGTIMSNHFRRVGRLTGFSQNGWRHGLEVAVEVSVFEVGCSGGDLGFDEGQSLSSGNGNKGERIPRLRFVLLEPQFYGRERWLGFDKGQGLLEVLSKDLSGIIDEGRVVGRI